MILKLCLWLHYYNQIGQLLAIKKPIRFRMGFLSIQIIVTYLAMVRHLARLVVEATFAQTSFGSL